MSARSRRKDLDFERKVAQLLRLAGTAAGPDATEVRWRPPACPGDRETATAGLLGLAIECSHGRRVNLRGALGDAPRAASPRGDLPIAICRDDNQRPLAVLHLADALDLVVVWLRAERPLDVLLAHAAACGFRPERTAFADTAAFDLLVAAAIAIFGRGEEARP